MTIEHIRHALRRGDVNLSRDSRGDIVAAKVAPFDADTNQAGEFVNCPVYAYQLWADDEEQG